MTRAQLEHAIRAACDIAQDSAVFVFGSQAILGQYPTAPARLRQSVEVDVSPRTNIERLDAIDGAIGEMSPFHAEHGFYVHGIPIEEAAKLPPGWKTRVVSINDPVGTLGKTGLCLEAHDLAASKLAAFREKDTNFVRVLLVERLISVQKLRARVRTLPIEEDTRQRCLDWITRTAADMPRGRNKARTRRR